MEEERAKSATWSRVKERIGVALWTSFLAACVETAAFFAYLDPRVLGARRLHSRLGLRAAGRLRRGFFLFLAIHFCRGGPDRLYARLQPQCASKRSEGERP